MSSSLAPLVYLFIALWLRMLFLSDLNLEVRNDDCPAVHHIHTPDDRADIPIKITQAIVPILITGMHEDLALVGPAHDQLML